MNLRSQCTPIKWGFSHKSPALATNTSCSFMMSAATLRGQRPSRTTPRALEQMGKVGIVSKHQVLDNQASVAYKKAIRDSDMTYELVPPDDHQRNMAEKASQTFKDHFVGILSGCAPTFLLHLWCQVLPQVEQQLLLLKQS